MKKLTLYASLISFSLSSFASSGERIEPYSGSFVQDRLSAAGLVDPRSMVREGLNPERQVFLPVDVKSGKDAEKELFKTLDVNYTADENAAIFYVFRLPSQFSMRSRGRNSFTIGSSAANTRLQNAIVTTNDGNNSRSHVVDTNSQTTSVTWEVGDKENEFSVSVRFFEIMRQPDLPFYMVSDNFIEKFHKKIGFKDPYNQASRMNVTMVDMRDLKGREFHGEDGDLYVLPIVVKRGFFKTIQESGSSKTTLNYGVQAQIPVQQPFGYAGVGTYANVSHNVKVSERNFLTFAMGLGLNIHRNFGSSSYRPYDDKAHVSSTGTVAVAFSHLHKSGKAKSSVVLSATVDSPVLDSDKYREAAGNRFIDRQSVDAVTKTDQVFGIAYVYEARDWGFSVGCYEDWGNYRTAKGRRTMDGRNNRDFSCAFKVRKTL